MTLSDPSGAVALPEITVPVDARQRRDRERRSLGLSWSEWILFKACEWTRLYGVPPSAMDWNVPMARRSATPERAALLAERYSEHVWPSTSTTASKFGSWNAMIEAAGLPAVPGGRRRTRARDQWPKAQARRERIEALLLEGRSRQEVADALGISRASLAGDIVRMRQLGFDVPDSNRSGVTVVRPHIEPPEVVGPSPAVLQQIAALWRLGAPVQEIADTFTGGHPGVLLSHVERCRAANPSLPVRDLERSEAERQLSPEREARLQEVAELWRSGLRSEVIADRLAVARSTVWADVALLRDRGVALPERPPGRPRLDGPSAPVLQRRARVRTMDHAGLNTAAIAERLGVTPATVRADLRAIRDASPSRYGGA
jgi:DNA-binding CsgD family transcriptional regulator